MKLKLTLTTILTLLLLNNVLSQAKPNAKLKVTISKSEVFQYEPVVVTVSALVHVDNKVPMRFVDLGSQVAEMNKLLIPNNCWVRNNGISTIEKTQISEGNEKYIQYKLIELALAPMDTGILTIPKLSLFMDHLKIVDTTKISLGKIRFESKEQQVKVKPLVSSLNYTNDLYKMVGDIELITTPKVVSFTQTGAASDVQLQLSEKGFTFPVEPKFKKSDSLIFKVAEVIYKDTIINNELIANKKFKVEVIPKMPGEYLLTNYLTWNYFSPETEKEGVLSPTVKIIASNSNLQPPKEEVIIANSIIALDVSESMFLEDYQPNRLQLIINAICGDSIVRKTPIIVFAGNCKEIKNFCGVKNHDLKMKRGTAIGNAIWYAKERFKASEKKGNFKIILIGDGDNTAGEIMESMATKVAKKYGIKIYCVGIGTKGEVPMAKNSLGVVNYVNNTFSEEIFKNISSSTGGEYFKFESTLQLQEVLKNIILE